ncbi:MAG: hypothetical protein JW966_04420, partial [Anaerolineae bacterium]|nr:hypothetical protein [Anaerolineae bacterium]
MKPETDQPTTGQDIFSNRRYRTVLTAAVMLFLAMLTMAILVGILVNSREEDREAEFDSTLTAVYAELPMLATMLAQTPSDFAAYSVMLAPGSPVYTAAEPCDQHILTGLMRDSDGTPTDALDVVIW